MTDDNSLIDRSMHCSKLVPSKVPQTSLFLKVEIVEGSPIPLDRREPTHNFIQQKNGRGWPGMPIKVNLARICSPCL